MRQIKHIIIHCSATPEGRPVTMEDIKRWHVEGNKWSDIGYHYVIELDGTVKEGRPIERIGSHTYGYNKYSIGVCYVGGMDKSMNPKDTRTDAQKESMKNLVEDLYYKYREADVKGHRDFSKDLDGDGVIEEHEWMKACPSFDVKSWFKEVILCE